MATVTAYWRPLSIPRASELLDRPGAVVLAGGTKVNAGLAGDHIEVVDLQALNLDRIDPVTGDGVVIGAMATLQQVADSDDIPAVVREAARREQPSTLRAQATVGGCIAAGWAESELLAALLVYEAVVHVGGRAGGEFPLEAVLGDLPLATGRIITAVQIGSGGQAAAARAARTRADRAIVAAYARAHGGRTRMALTGVAPTPILVDTADHLNPPGDFRGSAGYRQALARTLLARAAEAIR